MKNENRSFNNVSNSKLEEEEEEGKKTITEWFKGKSGKNLLARVKRYLVEEEWKIMKSNH